MEQKLKEKENQEEEMKELNEKMNLKIKSLESDKIYLKEQIDMYQYQLETNALTKNLIENADKGNNRSTLFSFFYKIDTKKKESQK